MAQIVTITNPLTGQPAQVDQLEHTAQQIDDAIARALPGGAIDITLANKAPIGFGWGDNKYGFYANNDSDGSLLTAHLDTVLEKIGVQRSCRFSICDWPYIPDTNNGAFCTLSNIGNGKALAVITAVGANSWGPITIFLHKRWDTGWQPPEYLNPPLILGVEYRTVERHYGKPVYVKAVDFGALPNTTIKRVAIDNQNQARAIRVSGLLNNGVTIPGTDESQVSNEKPLQCYGYNNNLCIYAPYDASAKTAVVTAWYYKTTD